MRHTCAGCVRYNQVRRASIGAPAHGRLLSTISRQYGPGRLPGFGSQRLSYYLLTPKLWQE